jgi:hypothetical protein
VKNYRGFGRRSYDRIYPERLRSPSRVPKQSQKLNPRYRCALISKKNLFLVRQDYRKLTTSTDVRNLKTFKIYLN